MARNVDMRDNYVHNFVGYQKDRPCDILLFNSMNKQTKTAQICGWLPKEQFLKKQIFLIKVQLELEQMVQVLLLKLHYMR